MIWRILLVFANVLFALLMAPLLDGIERKIRAWAQNRRGPNILQSWYDLLKLFKKPSGEINDSPKTFIYGPYIAFSYITASLFLIPMIFYSDYSFYGDLILLIYLFIGTKVFLVIGGISSTNPYSLIGSSREVSMSIVTELIFAEILGIIGLSKGYMTLDKVFPLFPPYKITLILAITLLAILVYVEHQRLPFELAEAEPELAGGVILEYTGRDLGIILYTVFIRRLAYTTILLDLILPSNLWFRLFIYPISLFLVSIICSLIDPLFGRYRINIALSYMKKIALVGGVLVVAAVFGL